MWGLRPFPRWVLPRGVGLSQVTRPMSKRQRTHTPGLEPSEGREFHIWVPSGVPGFMHSSNQETQAGPREGRPPWTVLVMPFSVISDHSANNPRGWQCFPHRIRSSETDRLSELTQSPSSEGQSKIKSLAICFQHLSCSILQVSFTSTAPVIKLLLNKELILLLFDK